MTHWAPFSFIPNAAPRLRLKVANDDHDTLAIQAYLGHRSIMSTVRYTALTPTRFKNFWNPWPVRCSWILAPPLTCAASRCGSRANRTARRVRYDPSCCDFIGSDSNLSWSRREVTSREAVLPLPWEARPRGSIAGSEAMQL